MRFGVEGKRQLIERTNGIVTLLLQKQKSFLFFDFSFAFVCG